MASTEFIQDMVRDICRRLKAKFKVDRKSYRKARHQKAMTRKLLRASNAREHLSCYLNEQLSLGLDNAVRKAVYGHEHP